MNFYYRRKRPSKKKKYTYKDFIHLSSLKIIEKLKIYKNLNKESENILSELDILKQNYENILARTIKDLRPYIKEKEAKIKEGEDLLLKLNSQGYIYEKSFFFKKKIGIKEEYKKKIESVEETIGIIKKNINFRIDKSFTVFPSETFKIDNKIYVIKVNKGDITCLNNLRYSWSDQEIKLNGPIFHKFNELSHIAMKQKFESERFLKPLEKALNIVEKNEDKFNKVKEESSKYKAQAYAHQKKTRDLSEEIKKEIKNQTHIFPVCPYCEKSLGLQPHADHIYPVSLGGLGTKENMVYVCAKCNQEKKALTLREFINKKLLNRSRVENNLSLLGKKF